MLGEFLKTLEVVGLTPEVKDAAISLRRRHKLTIPDAVIVATAQTGDAALLTNDAKLMGLPDVRARSVIVKG